MPRPSSEDKVRQAVRVYVAAAISKSPDEAPLNVLAAAKQTGFNRKTLKKYGLEIEIAAAAKQQARAGKVSPQEAEQRSRGPAQHSACRRCIRREYHPTAREFLGKRFFRAAKTRVRSRPPDRGTAHERRRIAGSSAT